MVMRVGKSMLRVLRSWVLSTRHNGSDHANVNVRPNIEGQVISIVGTDGQNKVELAVNWAQWEAQRFPPAEYPETALNRDRRGLATPNLPYEPRLKCLPEK